MSSEFLLMSILRKLSFRDQAFKLREDAILDATTSILGEKGFDLLTMDDVAGAVGISKPSLYKHFKSKDDLVGEAMIRLLDGALSFMDQQDDQMDPVGRLSDLLEWALRVRLTGGLPFLPSTSPSVREFLMKNLSYIARIMKLNGRLEKLVRQAQKNGDFDPALPCDAILFSFYSRTCDPAVDYLQQYSKMDPDSIVQAILKITLDGFRA